MLITVTHAQIRSVARSDVEETNGPNLRNLAHCTCHQGIHGRTTCIFVGTYRQEEPPKGPLSTFKINIFFHANIFSRCDHLPGRFPLRRVLAVLSLRRVRHPCWRRLALTLCELVLRSPEIQISPLVSESAAIKMNS